VRLSRASRLLLILFSEAIEGEGHSFASHGRLVRVPYPTKHGTRASMKTRCHRRGQQEARRRAQGRGRDRDRACALSQAEGRDQGADHDAVPSAGRSGAYGVDRVRGWPRGGRFVSPASTRAAMWNLAPSGRTVD
jgi:hypothetical protein